MNRSSTTTRATTMYGSTTAISSSPAPIPAPRPKSEVIAPPKRSLPPPPPPVPISSISSAESLPVSSLKLHAPNRPVPSIPVLPSPTHAVSVPKRNLPPPPPPPISAPTPTEEALKNTQLNQKVTVPVPRPISVISQSKPSSHVSSLVSHAHQPKGNTSSVTPAPISTFSNSMNNAPLQRRPTSTFELAKPPLIRSKTIASEISSEHGKSSSSLPPNTDNTETEPALPKRHVSTFSIGRSISTHTHTPIVGLPNRVAPTTSVETLNEQANKTSYSIDHSKRAVPTPLASIETPRRTVPASPAPQPPDLPKRTVPLPPPVEPLKRPVPAPPVPVNPLDQSVHTPSVHLDPSRRPAPIPPSRIEPVKRPTPVPPSRPTPSQTQTDVRPPLPSRPISHVLIKPQNEQMANSVNAVRPSPSKPPRILPPSIQNQGAETNPTSLPVLPQRPALPSRSNLLQKHSMLQPELPQRPALPKRPGQTTSHEHHSSSHFSSNTHTSSLTNGSTSLKSSSHSSSYHSSTTCNSHAKEDPVTALSRSKPMFTSEFQGERLDLSLADFSAQDQHARACPNSEEESIERLSWYLTSPFPGDQVAQLRAIFTWIGSNIVYNLKGFYSGNLGDNSANGVLRSKTGVCEGFANLFLALSEPQRLGAYKISGVARGLGIEPGGESLGGAHAWIGVIINGEYLLIDATWGAGTDDQDATKAFKPFYFLTRPEVLIYSHWPKNTREQYLDPPVHVNTYRDLPFITYAAWEYSVKPTGKHATHTIKTDNDYFEFDVRLSRRSWDGATSVIGSYLEWKPSGEKITLVCHWKSEDEECVIMTVKGFCPAPGVGEIVVFAQHPGELGSSGRGAIQYKLVNEGTGSNSQEIMQTYRLPQFHSSILEPMVAKVQSGVMQIIRVRVTDVQAGFQPALILIQGSAVDHLREVEPGLYEIHKVLRPGAYKIGHETRIHGGFTHAYIGMFEAL
ncbi:hypothetical protein BGZ76_009163 [Entomortierella beljakovae]|nr:hypothetical protein BGZ76_009163 [Entomortierella beljakovae]